MSIGSFFKKIPTIKENGLKSIFINTHWLEVQWKILTSKDWSITAFVWKNDDGSFQVVKNDRFSKKYANISWFTFTDNWNIWFIWKIPKQTYDKYQWIKYVAVINWAEDLEFIWEDSDYQEGIKRIAIAEDWLSYWYFWRIDATHRKLIQNWKDIMEIDGVPTFLKVYKPNNFMFINVKEDYVWTIKHPNDKYPEYITIWINTNWYFHWRFNKSITEENTNYFITNFNFNKEWPNYWFILNDQLNYSIHLNELPGIRFGDLNIFNWNLIINRNNTTKKTFIFNVLDDWFEIWENTNSIHKFKVISNDHLIILQSKDELENNTFRYSKRTPENQKENYQCVEKWLQWEFMEDWKSVKLDWKTYNRKLLWI